MSQQMPPPAHAHGLEQREFERLDNELARIVDNAVGQVSPLLKGPWQKLVVMAALFNQGARLAKELGFPHDEMLQRMAMITQRAYKPRAEAARIIL